MARRKPNYDRSFKSFVKIAGVVQKCPQCKSPDSLVILDERKRVVARFENCLPYVIQNEGKGYEEGPEIDQPTNTGIILRDLADYYGVPITSVNKSQLATLTDAQIADIYRKLYWDKLRLDEVTDYRIACCIFDTGVVRGLSIGAKYAQKVCNMLGAALVIDGEIGFQTIAALNLVDARAFITHYESLVAAGYMAIVDVRPADQMYLKGWLARARRLLTLLG